MKPEVQEKIRKLLALVGSLLALTISVSFAVLYYRQYEVLNDKTLPHCVPTKENSFNNVTASVDVNNRFRFLFEFGFGVFAVQSIAIIFSLFTICFHFASYINIVIQAFISIPALVQVIWVGVYRWSWYSNACTLERN